MTTTSYHPTRLLPALAVLACLTLLTAPSTLAQQGDTLAASTTAPSTDGDALNAARLRYKINMNMAGAEMKMEGLRTISEAAYAGRPVWRLVDGGDSQWGSYADTVEVDRKTLYPVRRRSVGSQNTTLLYSATGVKGEMSMGPQTMPIDVTFDKPVFGSESSLELAIAGMPLAEGYKADFSTFHPYSMQARAMKLAVTKTETVEVPAGTFETLLVEVAPVGGDAGERWALHVMPTPPHYLVQGHYHLPENIGGGLITVTLMDKDAGAE